MAANTNFKQSLKYMGGIIFHGLEYVIRHEVVLFFKISSTNSLFTIVVINIGFKIKVDQGVILVGERVTNLTFKYNLVES